MPNPNSNDIEDIARWMSLYDVYQSDIFPHLLYFDSWPEAVKILRTVDLAVVSQKMGEHNIAEFHRIGKLWAMVFDRIRKKELETDHYPESIDVALQQKYDLGPIGQDAELRCREQNESVKRGSVDDFAEGSHNPGSKCKILSTPEHEISSKLVKNLLFKGSYLEVCKQPKFDPEVNTLSCTLGDKVLTLSDPFKCVEDISVTPDRELTC